jgi:RHS repeat-associated protein
LTGIVHQQGTNPLSNRTWTYDAAGRIVQYTSTDGNSSYSYDNTDQLTAVDRSDLADEAYSYDANGNRTNAGYTNSTNNRLTGDGTFTYNYDNEGNRTKRTKTTTGEVTNYSWDYRNRLTRVEERNNSNQLLKSAIYTYDIFDRRLSKTVDPDGAGTLPAIVERFIYDRDHILLSFDGNSNLTHRYLHGAMLDQILADDRGNNLTWMLTDNIGTVRDIVNNSGAVQNSLKYESFGKIASQTNASVETRFGYTGRELDSESGLSYYRARYYDPAVGRFISEDPISFVGGDVNLYRYVGNSPVDGIDPMGTIALVDDVTIIAIVVISIGIGIAASNISKTLSKNDDREKKRVDDISIPFNPPCDENQGLHRGRIQAQGGGTEKSVPWARNTPPTKTEGLTYLMILKSQLTKRELKDREKLFPKVEKWINSAAQAGGVSAYVQQKFQKPDSKDIRIDVEVTKGLAFIPD